MSRPVKPSFIALTALLAAFVVGTSTAATAQTSTIRACVNLNGYWTSGPAVAAGCANDNWITWNAAGPQGPAGPAGPKGDAGEQGPAGSLPSATVGRITAKLRQVELAEARLAKAKPGSTAERRALLALSKAQRQATAELARALSG